MGLCKKAKILIPNQVHEVISGVVDERYISRYCNPKLDESHEDNQEDDNIAPGSRIGFEEWVWAVVTHSWDQNSSNHKAILYVQESFYHLQLQNGGPQEGAFQFMNPKAFQSHITWSGDRPIFLEGTHSVTVEAEQGEVEESIEEEKGEGEENNDDERGSSENTNDGDKDMGHQSDNDDMEDD